MEAFMRAVMQLILLSALVTACTPTPPTPAEASSEAAGEAEATAKSPPQASTDADEAAIISAPAPDSPEAVIRGILEGAMNPDSDAGWETTKALLHSNLHTARALKSYRELNYPASRRKVALFTPDDTKPHFRVARRQTPAADKIKLFIHNEKSMPTPCTLRKDPQASGAWRIHACSL